MLSGFGATLVASLGCQPISAYSHLIAAGVAFAAAVPLVRLGRGNRTRVIALSIYATCVVAALFISGAYHSCDRGEPTRQFMQRLDHYAIWALIAGTFTALHATMWRGFWRGGVLAIIWTYAAVGITLQVMWFRIFSSTAGLYLYLGMGWIGAFSIVKLARQLGFAKVLPFIYSGVAFSSGAILESRGWPVLIIGWFASHEILHLLVVLGCALNWLFIRNLLINHAPFEPAFETVERTLITDQPDAEGGNASGGNVAA
jgi:channel protein (hemolysin III family)